MRGWMFWFKFPYLGEAGHIQIIKSISRDSPLPSIEYLKISGGIFHDCMVHDVDMQTWVLGELPVQVNHLLGNIPSHIIKIVAHQQKFSFYSTFNPTKRKDMEHSQI